MLNSTQIEQDEVTEYFLSQSEGSNVSFVQKVYAETVLNHMHEIWDLHSSDGRWWIITNPTNLYSQDPFPNMDLALTFHMGLCLRIPRSDRGQYDASKVRPFGELFRGISECDDALTQANDSGAYRAIGVRCRENLLAFVHIAQDAGKWIENAPKRSDYNGWVEAICDTIYVGQENRERRRLLKKSLKEAWTFSNWLTHSHSGCWLDAEMATTATSHALGMATSIIIRHLRGVPNLCPACQSPDLIPEEGMNVDSPEVIFERPLCENCGWKGDPIHVGERTAEEIDELISREGHPSDNCGHMASPLRGLIRPRDDR